VPVPMMNTYAETAFTKLKNTYIKTITADLAADAGM